MGDVAPAARRRDQGEWTHEPDDADPPDQSFEAGA